MFAVPFHLWNIRRKQNYGFQDRRGLNLFTYRDYLYRNYITVSLPLCDHSTSPLNSTDVLTATAADVEILEFARVERWMQESRQFSNLNLVLIPLCGEIKQHEVPVFALMRQHFH